MPSSSLGSNGDLYLNLANADVYNKISGSWTKVANIQGATGPAGLQGPPGLTTSNYTVIGNSANLTYVPVQSLGNVSITAPANGRILIVVTGELYLQCNNNTATLGLSTSPTTFGLARSTAGVTGAGPVTASGYYSMTVQATYYVYTGNTTTFYANAWRETYNDQPVVQLENVYLTAWFSAT